MRSKVDRQSALQSGYEAECFVAKTLCDQGWRVLARNWRGGGGELDIIASRSGCLRFVEVKARDDHALGLEVITASKQRRLISAAEAWLDHVRCEVHEMCFVVALVSLEQPWTIDWFDDPFDC